MRGSDEQSGALFSYVNLEARVRPDHPLRTIRQIANAALSDLSKEFSRLYTDFGRPSIAPEKLLRSMLLQAFYGVRSERLLMARVMAWRTGGVKICDPPPPKAGEDQAAASFLLRSRSISQTISTEISYSAISGNIRLSIENTSGGVRSAATAVMPTMA